MAPQLYNILISSLENNSFIRMILSSPYDKNGDLNKVTVRLIELKGERALSFLYTYRTKTVTKNHGIEEGEELADKLFGDTFTMCVIFTTESDHSFRRTKKDKILYKKSKPAHSETDFSTVHNLKKKRMINLENNIWLQRLGVAKDGTVTGGMSGKFRQINRFVETIDGLIDGSDLKGKTELTVFDMGSGKGYLTFAVYDFFVNQLKIKADITGIEYRQDLVDKCSNIAGEAGFSGLKFLQGSISDFDIPACDILIALHACDTATDDALFKGISSGAEVIVVSPCCHKQIRKQLEITNELREISRHGILEERLAEMATDSLRALMLEAKGYSVNVFEYISDEHTHKNIMITAVKQKKTADPSVYLEKIGGLKKFLGIKRFYLEDLFNNS
ncbi:MAG TPA: SAM-dependent methyltransferase [Clostridiales bacterium]|nr:SAM-dependent methyltransferase [Clostridiales bacterium]